MGAVERILPQEGFRQLRGWLVHHHFLWDGEGIYLIDGGFLGGVERIESALVALGRTWREVRVLILTHGHLDHTVNARRIKEMTGCEVFAPARDRAHVLGRATYHGLARVAGAAEWVGRRVLAFEAPVVDHWFEAGDRLPAWGGLEVVPLPGHTMGHCGFYQPGRKLLFAGDLFSNYWGVVKLPPPWFNMNSRVIRRSVATALDLDLTGVVPNHSREASPEDHLRDLRALGERLLGER